MMWLEYMLWSEFCVVKGCSCPSSVLNAKGALRFRFLIVCESSCFVMLLI